MKEEKTKVIGENTYLVRQLSVTPAQRLFVRVSKLIGPALALAASEGKKGLGAAASEFFARLSEDEVEMITQQMAAVSEVNGKPMKACFELHFSKAGPKELWTWLLFALEVQFGDFFDELLGDMKSDLAAGVSSMFPSNSGGQSGVSSSTASQP